MDGNERASPFTLQALSNGPQGLAESLRRRDAGQKSQPARAEIEAWLG